MTRLSPREREIVELVGRDGARYKTVAAKLGITVATVRTYVARIAHKYGYIPRNPRDVMMIVYHSDAGTFPPPSDPV